MLRIVLALLLCLTFSPFASAQNSPAGDLYRAASTGGTREVEALIANGVDVNGHTDKTETNPPGLTALIGAAQNDDLAMVKLLLAHGADINEAGGRLTPLIAATESGDMDLIHYLLDHKADLNGHTANGFTALMAAVEQDNPPVFQLILDAEPNLNATAYGGYTAVMFAAMYGRTDALRKLLAAGAYANAKTNGGDTALIVAMRCQAPDVRYRRKYYSWICCRPKAGVMATLLAFGADPNVRRSDGATPLIIASEFGLVDAVRELIAGGANLNARGNDGATALTAASRLPHNDGVVQILKDAGASP